MTTPCTSSNPTVRLLAEATDRLQRQYESRVDRLAAENPMVPPADMLDSNGRPILLDALTAIVNARAALVAAEVAGR